MIEQDHVARLLAADIEPARLHHLEHVAIADLGAYERQADPGEIAFEPQVAHHRRHDSAAL